MTWISFLSGFIKKIALKLSKKSALQGIVMGKARKRQQAASSAKSGAPKESRQQRKRRAKRSTKSSLLATAQRPVKVSAANEALLAASSLAFSAAAAAAVTGTSGGQRGKGKSMSIKARRNVETAEIARLKMVNATPIMLGGGASAMAAMRAHLLSSGLLKTEVGARGAGKGTKKKQRRQAGGVADGMLN